MNNQYFCKKCNSVVDGINPDCCGRKMTVFDLQKHAQFLIGSSNSWISVWQRWKDHPEIEKTAKQVYAQNNYGAAMILNTLINNLLKEKEQNKQNKQ